MNFMQDYGSNPTIPLARIQSERFAEHAKEHDGATWERVSINFEPSKLTLILTRDRDKGDDIIQDLLPKGSL